MLADEALKKLCHDFGKPEAIPTVLAGKAQAIANLLARNLSPDDIKRAKGEIYNVVKTELKSTGHKFGFDANFFCRDIMASRIAPGMSVYDGLKSAIFDP